MLRRLLLLLVILITVIAGLLLLRRDPQAVTSTWETVAVRRGLVVVASSENGTLAPRTPVLATAPFEARLSWMVEDATWVTAGAPLAILADDEEQRRLAEERSQLEDARQELAINRLKRVQTEDEETVKVTLAKRTTQLERGRHRVATATAVGGEELVRLAQALAPIEERLRDLRRARHQEQSAWQVAEDRHLDALGRWQEAQDEALRLESRILDLEDPAAQSATEGRTADTAAAARQLRRRERAAAESLPAGDAPPETPAALRSRLEHELAASRLVVAGLATEVATAKRGADDLRPARDAAAATLDAAEEEALDLRLRLEIERRVLPATTLTLDRDQERLELRAADRRLGEGRAAFAAKALSQAALEDLEAAREDTAARLAILEERLAVAAAPPTPEAVAEAAARLVKAEADEAAAIAGRERALAIIEQSILVSEARVRRAEASIAARSRRFPATIQVELETRERERAGLPAGSDTAALDATIAALREDLAKAKTVPPNVVPAPVAGLVRVRQSDGRVRQAGDQVFSGDALVEVHPPGNLEVIVRANESVVAAYRPGMPVRLTIPALGDLARTGSIASVAGVGRDKSATAEDSGTFTGVTQFDVRVSLDPDPAGRDGDLRQGMTVLVTIEQARHPDVLHLPRRAAQWSDGRFVVRRVSGGPLLPLDAVAVGDDTLLVRSGLTEGDTVVIERMSP